MKTMHGGIRAYGEMEESEDINGKIMGNDGKCLEVLPQIGTYVADDSTQRQCNAKLCFIFN